MKRLLDLLNDYYCREFGDDSIIPALPEDSVIGLAYTTSEDGEHDLSTSYDVNRETYVYTIDGEVVGEDALPLDSFMVDLEYCDFSDFIRSTEDIMYQEA